MTKTEIRDNKGYDFLVAHFNKHGTQPTLQKIKDHMGYGSLHSPVLMLRRLHVRGLIVYKDRKFEIKGGVSVMKKQEIKELAARFMCSMIENQIPDKKWYSKIIVAAEEMATEFVNHFDK